jgi:hypothetical protein
MLNTTGPQIPAAYIALIAASMVAKLVGPDVPLIVYTPPGNAGIRDTIALSLLYTVSATLFGDEVHAFKIVVTLEGNV